MANYEDSSDSDSEDSFQAEIESLSKACLPTSTSTSNPPPAAVVSGSGGGGLFRDDDDDDNEELDDLELVRSIKERYGVGTPEDVEPLATLPPPVSDDDDDEDDYAFYLSIKERYAKVDDDIAASGGVQPSATFPPPDSDEDEDDYALYHSIKERHAKTDDDNAVNGDAGGASSGIADVAGDKDDFDDFERELFGTADEEDASRSASTFPRAAQTFIEAIKKNRFCQKFVRDKLLHLEAKMEELKNTRKRLKTIRDFQVGCRKKIGRVLSQKQDARVQLISAPKQRANAKGTESNVSPMCYGPPDNSYVACYKDALEKFPISFHRDKWTEEDKQNLEKGVVRQYQEMLLQQSAQDLSSAEESCASIGVDAMMLSIKSQDITPKTIQSFSSNVNWQQLASTYLPRRSGEECEARWLNHENRLINKGPWTKQEDIKLLSLIDQNGLNNWISVAEQLATNRTPYQCLARYQRSLNPNILKREWTEDEDAQLCSAVESFGESNWQAVASVLEGRTGPQCSNRWKKTLHPARDRVGKWVADEDKRLKVAVTLFGKSWHKIAQFVPGRTQSQCRERWVNVLDPALTHSEWTEEEDMKLKEAIGEHGYCWSRVAACVPPRTDNQCLRRWTRLCPDDVPRLKAARSIQKVALIANFVDREEERPTLGPKDFVSLPVEGLANEQENGNVTQKRRRKRKCVDIEPTDNEQENVNVTQKQRRRRKRKCEDIEPTDNEQENVNVTQKRRRKRKCEDIEPTDNEQENVNVTQKRRRKRKCEDIEPTEKLSSRDIPIQVYSRRARRVESKGNGQDIGSNEVQRNQSTFSCSQVNRSSKEVEFSDRDDMPSTVKVQPQSEAISLTLSDDHIISKGGISDEGIQTHSTGEACSNKKKGKKKHKKSKVEPDQSEKWEHLPLSSLFKKASTRTR